MVAGSGKILYAHLDSVGQDVGAHPCQAQHSSARLELLREVAAASIAQGVEGLIHRTKYLFHPAQGLPCGKAQHTALIHRTRRLGGLQASI